MKVNTRLNLCLAFSILALILNGFTLVLDVTEELSVIYIVFDVIYLVCSIICTVLFSIFRIKGLSYTRRHKGVFIFAVCSGAVCSLILGFIAFFAYFDVFSIRNYKTIQTQNNDGTIKTDGRVIPTAEEITKKIKVIDDMLESGSITQSEYNQLKQDILNEITNN